MWIAETGLLAWDSLAGTEVLEVGCRVKIVGIKNEQHKGMNDKVGVITGTKDDRYIVVCGGNSYCLKHANVVSVEPKIQSKAGTVHSVAFSPNGEFIAAGSYDGLITLWDWTAEAVGPCKVLPGHTSEVNSVSFSKDGKQLISGSDDTTVRVWDFVELA